MKTINVYTRKDIEDTIKEKTKNDLNLIYYELDKMRGKINDIEAILKSKGEK